MGSPNSMNAKVSAKGWVVIPAALRKRHGIKPGSIVEYRDMDGGLVIIPREKDAIETRYGKFSAETSLTKALPQDRAKELDRKEDNLRSG